MKHEWLINQWRQIRGNFKYDLLKTAFLGLLIATGTGLWRMIRHIPTDWLLLGTIFVMSFAVLILLDRRRGAFSLVPKATSSVQPPTQNSLPLPNRAGQLAHELSLFLQEHPDQQVDGPDWRSNIHQALANNWERLPKIHDGYMSRFHDRVEKIIYDLGSLGVRDWELNDLVNREAHSDSDIQVIADKLLGLGAQLVAQEYKATYIDQSSWKRAEVGLPRGKKPHLANVKAESMGLYDLQPNVCGFGLTVTNDEMRYQSIAHNIKAEITYRHSLGDFFTVDGVWTTNDSPRCFSSKVSLKMDAKAYLLLVIWHNSGTDFYAPSPPLPPQFISEHRLEYGEWSVEINLKGDNAESTFNGVLLVTEKRGISFTPKDRELIKGANKF